MSRDYAFDATTGPLRLLFATAIVFTAFIAMNVADALTITNRTGAEQQISVKTGDQSEQLVLQPEETVSGICNSGCVIALMDGDEIEVEGFEAVSIGEDGLSIAE